MGIKQRLEADIKSALLSGDKKTVNILKMLKSAILDSEIAEGKRQEGLSEQSLMTLLAKESKKRQDAVELYTKAGESERASNEAAEKQVISNYLPKQMDDKELSHLLDEVISELGGELNQQLMGKVIAAVRDRSQGTVDGSRIAIAVKVRLDTK